MELQGNMSKALLNEHQASDILGLKVSTLRIRRFKKMPPTYLKIGSKVYYYKKDLDNYLKSCVQKVVSKKYKDA